MPQTSGTSIYLYIYKVVAILFLWTQTPPTILVIEGWNLGTNPAIVGGRPLTNFFEIGPRVPRLGPNLGQNLNKIAITREPLGRFGWNLDWRDIFKLYYHLNSMVKALKSTGIEIMVAQNTLTNLMYGAGQGTWVSLHFLAMHNNRQHNKPQQMGWKPREMA